MHETYSIRGSQTEEFVLAVRAMPLFRQIIPQEAGIGWPIPKRKHGGRVYITIPFYGYRKTDNGRVELYPIFATLTADWDTKQVVEYVDLKFSGALSETSGDQPVGEFPHQAISSLTVREYQLAKSRLLTLYDQLFDGLSRKMEFPNAFSEEFSELFSTLLEPFHEPQYRSLAEKFVMRFKK